MLPEISFVQKCPHCGKYYIRTRQAVKYEGNGNDNGSINLPSFERGLLTFPEMKEAFAQLTQEGFTDFEEEATVHLMLHHAYNDYYYRNDDQKDTREEDQKLFHENDFGSYTT